MTNPTPLRRHLPRGASALPPVLGLLLAAAAALVAAQQPRAQNIPGGAPSLRTPLQEEIPELADQSSWAQDTKWEGEKPQKRLRGVYPVGNGAVFTYQGLGKRANTMQGLTGPQYQTDEVFAPLGHYGELTCDLLRGTDVVALPDQKVRRVRGANFVVSEDSAPGGIALRTLTFATPSAHHITRVLEVTNHGETAVAGLRLRVTPELPVVKKGNTLRKAYRSKKRPSLAFYALTDGVADNETLQVALGALAPNATWRGVLTISTVRGEEPPAEWAPAAPELARATEEARKTLASWKRDLADTSYFDTDHTKLRDLVGDWKVMMLVQRCAQSGAVSPMVNYRGAWVRDSNGPMLFFLRFHMWDEARDLLKYMFRATRLLDRVPNHVPLDLDFGPLAGKKSDWAKVAVPAAEVPSWVILQHLWYWRATRDTALIREHWPLLEACIKKQRRAVDSLMTFHGDETWMHGALYSLYPDRVADGSGFIAEGAVRGRATYSFASNVLFMVAVQAIGELADAIDEAENPARWEKGAPDDAVGRAYVARSLSLRADLEKRYWIEDLGLFAPALSPVTGRPHRAPFANANLMPLWAGFTWPTSEKSRDNLRNSLARLWRKGSRIGTTPSTGYATGHLQGMLVFALSERDGKARLDCLDELLRLAEPAGEWGELYDPEGRPVHAYHERWPNRCRPWESGVNIDAIMYAINGIRFNTQAGWDKGDIRLEVRMPHGATYLTMKDIRKDTRQLHIFANQTWESMTDAEREQNQKQPADKQRDPDVAHKRFRFRIEQLSENPRRGYWNMGANMIGTLYPHPIWKGHVVEGMEFWAEDHLAFMPTGPAVALPQSEIPLVLGGDVMVLSNRSAAGEIYGHKMTTFVDTGLPWSIAEIADALIDGSGRPRYKKLLLDWGWNDPGRMTFKTAEFWKAPAWAKMLEQLRAKGGQVVEMDYFTHYDVEDAAEFTRTAAPGGRLALAGADATGAVRVQVESDADREAVLRIGSGCGLAVKLNGKDVLSRQGGRAPLPDANALLISLEKGTNVLDVRLANDGERVLFTRITDSRGLPVQGVRAR